MGGELENVWLCQGLRMDGGQSENLLENCHFELKLQLEAYSYLFKSIPLSGRSHQG